MSAAELHSKAMELADSADLEKSKGNIADANALYKEAFKQEKQAIINMLNFKVDNDFNLLVLIRSAASLASYYQPDDKELIKISNKSIQEIQIDVSEYLRKILLTS